MFEVAALARHSFSVSEVLRQADQQNPRAMALMGNLEEIPAKRKLVSLLYIGKNARKKLMDKFPAINILLIELRNLLQNCTESFQTRGNRTLMRKQKSMKSLNQFWKAPNGLSAKSDFETQNRESRTRYFRAQHGK